jgi:hypothetical protein
MCCSEVESNCVVTLPNGELSEPFGRLETLVYINYPNGEGYAGWIGLSPSTAYLI